MDDVAPLSADAIMAIPDDRPGFLFGGGPDGVAAEYRALIKRWHPNAGCGDPRAAEVADKITKLKDAAESSAGMTWFGRDAVTVPGADGKIRTVRYRRGFKTDVGETVYGLGVLAMFVRPEFAGLFADGLRAIGTLEYPTPAIQREIARYMPRVKTSFEARDGSMVLILEKTPDVFRLRDVIAALGGRVDPHHVAWIVNAALNIACYLERVGLTHNAISPDSFYVSPKHHSGLLLGDWWFAAKVGRPLSWVPGFAHATMPRDMAASRAADGRLDLALIRAAGCAMLGDATGMSLIADQRVPRRMADWLRGPTTGRAVEDYREWASEVLPACFGARKFIKLDLTDAQVFAEDSTPERIADG